MSAPYTAITIEVPNEDGVVMFTRKRAPAGDGGSLKFLQDGVKTAEHSRGYIEHLTPPSRPDLDWWMNEEGKLDRLPINEVATDLLVSFWPEWAGWDVICGNVVLTGNKGPETADVPEGLWETLQKMTWLRTVVFVDETAK